MQYTVLLVDDEQSILSALRRSLRKEGYNIITAGSGEEALSMLAEQQVQLIVSDQMMPTMSGTEFFRKVRDIYPDTIRILLSGYTNASTLMESVNEGEVYKFFTKPWNDEELKVAIRRSLEQYELMAENRQLLDQVQMQNMELTKLNASLEDKMRQLQEYYTKMEDYHREAQEAFVTTIEILGALPELKDPYISNHSERVREHSVSTGIRLGIYGERLDELGIAAKLHDIGNIGVESYVLNKPGRLTPEEFEKVKMHVIYGERVLSFIKEFEWVSKVIRHHHEAYDGSGYPDGLKGEDIPLESRIIFVAESYDSLVSPRPFREAMNHGDAVGKLELQKGGFYDPSVLEAFLATLGARAAA